MPYIAMTTAKTLTEEQKDRLKTAFGELITRIPGKSEGVLMISIQDGVSMYFRGEKSPCAFLDVRLFGKAETAAQKSFTQGICGALEEIAGIPGADVFLCFGEYPHWGLNGSLI